MEKILYEELTPREFEQRLAQAPVAYLPLGTLEWHGLHLPLGSDGLQSRGLFCRLAREVGGIVMPMLFVGPDRTKVVDGETYIGMDFWSRPEDEQPRQLPGSAYHVTDELFAQLIDAIMAQLARAGFRVVVGHGHGPSNRAFSAMIPIMKEKYGLTLINGRFEGEQYGYQSDHAAANETSLMLLLHPDLVHMDELSPDPARRPEAIMGLDPRYHASTELGQAAMEEAVSYLTHAIRNALK